jgi:hypothetical protein
MNSEESEDLDIDVLQKEYERLMELCNYLEDHVDCFYQIKERLLILQEMVHDFIDSEARIRMMENIFLTVTRRLLEILKNTKMLQESDFEVSEEMNHHEILELEKSSCSKYTMLTNLYELMSLQDPLLNNIAHNVSRATFYTRPAIVFDLLGKKKPKKRSFFQRLLRRKKK